MSIISKDWKNFSKSEGIDQDDYIDDEFKDKIIAKYAYIIGVFLINFNNLEYELNRTISQCFCDDAVHEGYLVTKELMFRNRVELFNDLVSARICYSKKKEIGALKLKILCGELTEINTFRNYVIHANWLTLDKEGYVRTKIVVDGDGGYVKGKKVKITTSLIRSQIKRIDVLINKLFQIEDYIYID